MSSRLATAVGVVVVLGAAGLVAWGFIEAVNAEPAFLQGPQATSTAFGAPAKTLLAFTQWERDTGKAQAEKDEVGMALAWEALLRAIRQDLGHNDSALPRGELLAVFLDDEARELVAQRT
jgi:hypothetical protein